MSIDFSEKAVPLSESLIWRLQREAYAERGLKTWTEDLVPQFITNNPFIAEIYARIVSGFLCDCVEHRRGKAEALSEQKPLRVLELGAGCGKFSFLFLKNLEERLQSKDISLRTVRYCMTDYSGELVQAWQSNRFLTGFAERGILEFRVFDANGDITNPFVSDDGSQLSTQNQGPLVVIANYVFDSLPQDVFAIQDGRIYEFLQSTTRDQQTNSDALPVALSQMQFAYKQVEPEVNRYQDEHWKDILESYRHELRCATVPFPSQALKVLQAISKFTDGTMLIVAADKGYVYAEDLLLSQGNPTFEFHSKDYFSQMVNFDAIGKYFESKGGQALLPKKHSSKLNVCGFLQSQSGVAFPATMASYKEVSSAFGPDDLFALLGWLNPHMEEMSVTQILALLRLSCWDATTFIRLFPVLARQVRAVTAERSDLRSAVLSIWENYFPVNPSDAVLVFDCGVILLELQFFEEAFSMFKQSQEVLGRSAATSYNLGLCCQGLSRPAEALIFMVEACQQDHAFEPARLARRKLEGEQAAG